MISNSITYNFYIFCSLVQFFKRQLSALEKVLLKGEELPLGSIREAIRRTDEISLRYWIDQMTTEYILHKEHVLLYIGQLEAIERPSKQYIYHHREQLDSELFFTDHIETLKKAEKSNDFEPELSQAEHLNWNHSPDYHNMKQQPSESSKADSLPPDFQDLLRKFQKSSL